MLSRWGKNNKKNSHQNPFTNIFVLKISRNTPENICVECLKSWVSGLHTRFLTLLESTDIFLFFLYQFTSMEGHFLHAVLKNTPQWYWKTKYDSIDAICLGVNHSQTSLSYYPFFFSICHRFQAPMIPFHCCSNEVETQHAFITNCKSSICCIWKYAVLI